MRAKWLLQDGKWINSVTNEVDLRPGAGITPGEPNGVNTGRRPKPGERCFKPSESMQRDRHRIARDLEKARLERLRERRLQLARDLDSGKVQVDPEATIHDKVVEVKKDGVRHIVRADRLTPSELKRAEQAREAEIAARHAREVATPEPIDDSKLSAELAAKIAKAQREPGPDGFINRYSMSDGHDPTLPRPTPKPGADPRKIQSFDLSDLKSLPPAMRGAGIR